MLFLLIGHLCCLRNACNQFETLGIIFQTTSPQLVTGGAAAISMLNSYSGSSEVFYFVKGIVYFI